MKRFLSLFVIAVSLMAFPAAVYAEEVKPDDSVTLTLSAESWVTTKSARVLLNVEAAVTSGTAGTMRASMTKAVSDMVKADWRITSFNRSQDSTGMERWSAQYEARVAEAELNGLNDKAKQSSKAGMQITVADVDFSPTLEETQAALAALRTQIYKMANEQLTALNATIVGRGYRIAAIDFVGDGAFGPMPTPLYARGKRTMVARQLAEDAAVSMPAMERSDKLNLSARVVFAALPTASPQAPKAP